MKYIGILLIILFAYKLILSPILRGFKKGIGPGNQFNFDSNAFLSGPGLYHFDIVGESHYQDNLDEICGGKTENGYNKIVKATLIHEDNNPYDKNAIRVDIQGMTTGYLSRKFAKQYRKRLKEAGYPGIIASCSAKIVGGWNRGGGNTGHFGVKLDLPIK